MYNKNNIILFLCFTVSICLDHYLQGYEIQKYVQKIKILKEKIEEQAKDDSIDSVVSEIYDTIESLYKKIVEIVAVHYCTNHVYNIHYSYDRLIVDIGLDALKLFKLFILYLPKLYKNKQLSKIEKCKQVCMIGSILCILIVWSKKYCNKESLRENFQSINDNSIGYEYSLRPRPTLRS